jgi:hypothetical protein
MFVAGPLAFASKVMPPLPFKIDSAAQGHMRGVRGVTQNLIKFAPGSVFRGEPPPPLARAPLGGERFSSSSTFEATAARVVASSAGLLSAVDTHGPVSAYVYLSQPLQAPEARTGDARG